MVCAGCRACLRTLLHSLPCKASKSMATRHVKDDDAHVSYHARRLPGSSGSDGVKEGGGISAALRAATVRTAVQPHQRRPPPPILPVVVGFVVITSQRVRVVHRTRTCACGTNSPAQAGRLTATQNTGKTLQHVGVACVEQAMSSSSSKNPENFRRRINNNGFSGTQWTCSGSSSASGRLLLVVPPCSSSMTMRSGCKGLAMQHTGYKIAFRGHNNHPLTKLRRLAFIH